MSDFRPIVRAALVAACAAALPACSDARRGLPPPPTNVDYPNVNRVPADRQGRLKTQAEQDQLKADLLARKPPPGSRRTRRR